MTTSGLSDALSETLSVFETAGEPGEPLTTQEVTDRLDVSRRSTYDRLERLADRGLLLTKKAGARGRVWWQPPDERDGTDRQAAAAGLTADTERLLGRLIDDLPGIVYRCRNEPGWPMSYVSEGCAAVAGYDAEEIVAGEVSWGKDVIHPRDRQRVRDVVEKGVADDGQFALQYRIQTPDGETRWVWERGRAIGEDGDGPERLEGVIIDVTDQRESEQATTESDEQFRALVDATEEYAIFMLDRDGRVTTWNTGAERIKGYEAGTIIGEHFSTFYTEGDRRAGVPERNLARAVEQGVAEDEGLRVRADGSTFWANVTISAIRDEDGELQGFAKVTRDMTERHEQEQRLERERDLIDRLFETSPVGIAVFDADLAIVRANDWLETHFGFPIAEGEAYRPGELPLFDEDGDPVAKADLPVVEVLQSGEPVEDREMQIRPSERGAMWVSVNARPITADDGTVTRVVTTVSDVTQLKEQTQQLRQERDEIAAELEEMFTRIDDAFYAVDDEFRFTYLNERAEELLGQSEAELFGRSVWDVFPDATETPAWESFHTALETQEPTGFETYFEPLGFWVEATVYPSENGLSVYFRDVTERKVRESELERYETIVETMSDGVYVVDETGRFTMVNDAYAAMTGYDRDELLDAPASMLVAEDVAASMASLETEMATGQRDAARFEAQVERADGSEFTAEGTFTLVDDGDGAFERVGVVRDVTERRERERELEEARRRYQTLMEHFPNGAVTLVGPDLEYLAVGGSPLEGVDRSIDEIEGTSIEEAVPTRMAEVLVPRYEAAFEGESAAFEFSTEDRVYEIRIVPVRDDEGEVFAAIGMSQDVTAQKNREQELQRRVRQQEVITDLGKQALEDRDLDDLMATTAALVADTLDTDYCKVLDLDPETDALLLRQGVGWQDGVVGEATVSATAADSQAAHTLSVHEPVVVENLATEERFSGPDLLRNHGVTSGVSTIIGSSDDPWGILGVHDTTERTFTDHDVAFVQSVANILATAIERNEREQELVWQREQLAALNHLNEGVRNITEAAIEQSTRGEIEQVVCAALADSDSYQFAWIGEVDVTSQEVAVTTEAGVEGYLDDVTISVDPDDERSGGPTGQAFLTGEMQTTSDVRATRSHDPWRDHVAEYGFRSSAAIPLVHEGTVFGVLNVYSRRPRAFEGEEMTVLGQLGEVVGHAIAAVERKQALMSDELVELEFRIRDIFEALGAGDGGDGRIEFNEAVPVRDDEYLVYGTVSADGVETMESILEAAPHWESVTYRETEGDRRFELRLSEPPVLSAVAAMGGTVEGAVLQDGDYRMTLHLSPSSDVRRVIDTVQETYPSAEMLSRRQITRRSDATERVESVLTEELTDRQRTALRAAYHADFFEWPRETTGEDVATALDVSPPTFHQHLRKAEKKIFDSLLADDAVTEEAR